MSTCTERTARRKRAGFPVRLNEKMHLGVPCRSQIRLMNIMSSSQISDRMAPPTFSSIARQHHHEPFSSGIAELGDAGRRPRCHAASGSPLRVDSVEKVPSTGAAKISLGQIDIYIRLLLAS